MKSKLSNGLAFLMSLALLLNGLAILSPVAGDPAFEVYMVPATNNFDTDVHVIGYEWDIEFWVIDVPSPGAYAYQVKMWFNTAWLSCVGAALPELSDTNGIFYGLPTTRPPPAIDNGLGNVLIGDSLSGAVTPVQGAGPYYLGKARMRITDGPAKSGALYSDLSISSGDTYFLDDTLATMPGLTKTDGTAQYVWMPPPYNPNVAVSPSAITKDEYHNWTHPPDGPFQFDVEVKIENLHIAWALHNASVTLVYNTPEEILEYIQTTVDPNWAGPNNVVDTTPGVIEIFVQGYPTPSGDLVIATLTFNITHQGINPPQDVANVSIIGFTDYVLWDTVTTIDTEPEVNCTVTVKPHLVVPLPFFEVDPEHTVLGPELVVGEQFGKEFDVDVNIKNVHGVWEMIGWQLRLTFDPTLVEVVSVTEGDFLKDPRWCRYGTYFIPPVVDSYLPGETPPGTTNLVMGCLLYPNGGGEWDRFPGLWNPSLIVENLTAIEPAHLILGQEWHEVSPATCTMYEELDYKDEDHDGMYSIDDWIQLNLTALADANVWYRITGVDRPSGTHVKLHLEQDPILVEGTLATIRFKPIRQSWTVTYMCDFDIYPLYADSYLIDKDMEDISVDEGSIKNGDYTILPIEAVGRRVDVWICDYPFPYGGQGLGEPADLVVPQQLVCLCAKVTYNWWPVEGKLVTFRIYDNAAELWGTLTAISGADGHATVCFRMPWPGEDLFGVWTVLACVEVAELIVCDELTFHYDYLINLVSITTDLPEYAHLDTVTVTVEYSSQAQQTYTTWMDVAIKDELGVIVNNIIVELTVKGALYCEYKDYSATVYLEIPHSAYAGAGLVVVNFLDATAAAAVTPETTKVIWIMPI